MTSLIVFRLFRVFHRPFLSSLVLLYALGSSLSAAPPPELTVLRQQYDKVVAERVTVPFDAGLAELNTKYSAGLDRAIADAKAAGKLEDILAIEAEKKRLADKLPIPTTDDATEPESLKKFRAIYRQQFDTLTATRDKAQTDLLPPYTAKLKDLEGLLVKNDRVDEAKEVLAYRQGLAQSGPLSPLSGTSGPVAANAPQTPAQGTERTTMTPADAPKVKGDDRKAAEWILANWSDFRLFIDDHKGVSKTEGLPKGKFTIESIAIDGRFYTGTLTGEALQVLAGLQGLKTFTMGNFPDLKDDDLAFLAALPALEDLKLSKIATTGTFLSYLSGMKQLSILEVSELPNFTGATLDQLAPLTKLKIWKSKLTDEGVQRIPTSLKISSIDIQSHAGVTDACLPHLRQMDSLMRLFVATTQIKPEALGAVPMPKIDTLGANEISGMRPDEIMPKIAPAFPNVTTYTISYFVRTPEELACLAHFKKLNKLVNSGVIEDAAWPGIAELRNLQTMDSSTGKLTDAALQALTGMKKLKTIYLKDSKPSEAALTAFKKARPDVKLEK